jgi:hypothetical protein
MVLFVLAFLGGVLTILSPCILPILRFTFARADQGKIAVLASARGQIAFRFHARDLHLVLGPSANGKPVRFRMTIDGKAPSENHGVDANDNGDGTVTENRLYQLVRQKGAITDHTFTIEFHDPGVQAFAFTFG